MKKNLLLAFALGTAMMVTSCDQKSSVENTTASETPVAEQPQQIDNPNVVPTGQAATANTNAAVMSFNESEYDFGTIKQGEVVEHTFTFTNTGATPLVIESASASCGCTAPDWTKTPVAPGEKGEVKVQFNSAGKFGQQSPTVTIRANTEPNIIRIAMKGNVENAGVPTAGPEGPVKLN